MSGSGSKFTNVLKAKEDLQKSPEQLEREKREILKTRIIQLDLDGKTKNDLIQLARKLHQALTNLHSQIYDLTERYERQKYDMVELTERARQIEKGKAKTRKSNVVHTGLGGSAFSWLTDQYSSAPAKVSLFSRYERVTDRRTFSERRDAFMPHPKNEEFVPLRPKAKIRQVEENPPANEPIRTRRSVHEETARRESQIREQSEEKSEPETRREESEREEDEEEE